MCSKKISTFQSFVKDFPKYPPKITQFVLKKDEMLIGKNRFQTNRFLKQEQDIIERDYYWPKLNKLKSSGSIITISNVPPSVV